MATNYALFAPAEVIFDTVASKLVFENPNLLTDVAPSNSTTVIGGVQQGAPGVRIDDVGNLRDLGEVGIGKGAACKSLSACQMLDIDRTFKYDDKNDEFVVTGPRESYVFARRIIPDGSKPRFYTHHFAYIATVAKTLRRYSAREVKQMHKTAQLTRHLGHATRKAIISIINSGVMNYPVSATDVRNKDSAKIVSIAGLLGKTTKRESSSRATRLPLETRKCSKFLAWTSSSYKRSPSSSTCYPRSDWDSFATYAIVPKHMLGRPFDLCSPRLRVDPISFSNSAALAKGRSNL